MTNHSSNHNPDPRFWSLGVELYRFTHQWPLILIAIVAGCLLGWAAGQFLWPPSYRAAAEIYVALNPYRTFSDATFLALARPKYSNIDDYKNWQMSQLEAVIFTEAFIDETLQNLRRQDNFWDTVESDELLAMLDAEWRSAGTWSLVANHPDAQHAAEAAHAWGQTTVPRLQAAILAAQETFQIDQVMDAAAQEQAQALTRQITLKSTAADLLAWRDSAAALPQARPLEPANRWRLLAIVAPAADFTPAWMALLAAQPAGTDPLTSYTAWIDQALAQIDAESSELAQRIRILEEQQINLATRYAAASKASLGLSPNLEILEIQALPVKTIHPTGTLIIVGGLIGLLAWVFFQMTRIGRKAKPFAETAQGTDL